MGEEQNIPSNDQVSKEEFDALKLELEAEKAKSQEAVGQATQELTDRVASLEADLQAKDTQLGELGELRTRAEGQTQELATATLALESAVGAYKDVVLKANPLLPTDMIQGLTIDEVNASLDRALNVVGHISDGLKAQQLNQVNADKIPPGAPQRTGPDVSGMTTKEKINYGLEQARK